MPLSFSLLPTNQPFIHLRVRNSPIFSPNPISPPSLQNRKSPLPLPSPLGGPTSTSNCRFDCLLHRSARITDPTCNCLLIKKNLQLPSFFLCFTNMGGVLANGCPRHLPETKLDSKMVEAMQKRALKGTSMRSFNTIILKFQKIDEILRNCKTIFEQFDEDSNGSIDQDELKRCFHKLELSSSEEETRDFFEACDINEDMGINFNEFIVLICLVYLLEEKTGLHVKLKLGSPNLEAAFETLVDAFVFLDKNKDGYVSKREMVEAINVSNSGERSSGRIAMKRFEEMDWDRNGMVTFKEFLFAFTRWIGIDDLEDEEDEK